MNYRAIWE